MPQKGLRTRVDTAESRKRKRINTPPTNFKPKACVSRKVRYYEYSPLTTRTSIRILELQPGEETDLIECRLFIVARDKAPPYEAISYAWGSGKKCRAIGCWGRKLRITANLFEALRQIRDPVHVRLLWADAVCIDQGNMNERKHQVKQMGFIYANAVRVLVWLGFKKDGDDFRMLFYKTASIYVKESKLVRGRQVANLQTSEISQLRLEGLDDDTSYLLSLFARLLARPWFSRLWVVQEVGVAKSVLALIGDQVIDFEHIMDFIYRLRDKPLLLDRFQLDTKSTTVFMIFPARNKDLKNTCVHGSFDYDFLEVLKATTSQLASDPRDYIYALLGHPSAIIGGKPIVEPIYKKSVPELFSEVAIKLIEETKSLRILSGVYYQSESDLDEGTASWVPTWIRGVLINSIGLYQDAKELYDAAAGVPLTWELTPSEQVLHVHGFHFDVVDEFSGIMEDHDYQFVADWWPIGVAMDFSTRTTRSISENLSDLAQTMVIGEYRSPLPAKESFSRLLIDFAAFRLYLMEQAYGQGVYTTSDLAPEGIPAIQAAAQGGDIEMFLAESSRFCVNRKLFSTRNGRLGLGPRVLRKGDLCCILYGAVVPFILRQVGSRYRVVGEAYIHGVMNGEEMVDWILCEKYQEQVFKIF